MDFKDNRTLKTFGFLDFCIRCDEIYDYFWDFFAPNFDIAIYRDYLLFEAKFSDKPDIQEKYGNLAWEFLMGDILKSELYGMVRFRHDEFEKNDDRDV